MSREYYERMGEEYYHTLKKEMTRRDIVDLTGENDTTKTSWSTTFRYATNKYILTIEFDEDKVVNTVKTAKRKKSNKSAIKLCAVAPLREKKIRYTFHITKKMN